MVFEAFGDKGTVFCHLFESIISPPIGGLLYAVELWKTVEGSWTSHGKPVDCSPHPIKARYTKPQPTAFPHLAHSPSSLPVFHNSTASAPETVLDPFIHI